MYIKVTSTTSNMTSIVRNPSQLEECSCCCCKCSLRAAAIVLAWFNTISCIIQLEATCIALLADREVHVRYQYESKELDACILVTVTGSLIVHILLLYGIHNKRPAYMLPYLILGLIGMMVMTALTFIITIFMCLHSLLAGFIMFIILAIVTGLGWLFWLVPYRYYQQIKEEMTPTTPVVYYNSELPNDQMHITYPEEAKALCSSNPSKSISEIA
ncbi:uncharacterized protein [Periplaneta americana]|uniref:uncharacterized protein isoform X1 n=2 Tax=Periplaneta americana TaxID=6978 RepID=UPI0037E71B10